MINWTLWFGQGKFQLLCPDNKYQYFQLYSEDQLQDVLRQMYLNKSYLQKKWDDSIELSIIIHHGHRANAFEKLSLNIGFQWPIRDIRELKPLITPFFEILPDTIISNYSGIRLGVLKKWRDLLDIEGFSREFLWKKRILS